MPAQHQQPDAQVSSAGTAALDQHEKHHQTQTRGHDSSTHVHLPSGGSPCVHELPEGTLNTSDAEHSQWKNVTTEVQKLQLMDPPGVEGGHKRVVPRHITPLFGGGVFDANYNSKYKPYTFQVPEGCPKVVLEAVVTGQLNDICVVLHPCDHGAQSYLMSHQFTVICLSRDQSGGADQAALVCCYRAWL